MGLPFTNTGSVPMSAAIRVTAAATIGSIVSQYGIVIKTFDICFLKSRPPVKAGGELNTKNNQMQISSLIPI